MDALRDNMTEEKKQQMASKLMASLLHFTLLLLLFSSSLFSTLANAAIPFPTTPRVPKTIPRKLPPPNPFCPWDTLKLAACATALGDVASIVVGPPLGGGGGGGCCPLLGGLTDGEVAACLCAVIKESVLGVTTKWTVKLSALVSSCKKTIPDGFKCV